MYEKRERKPHNLLLFHNLPNWGLMAAKRKAWKMLGLENTYAIMNEA